MRDARVKVGLGVDGSASNDAGNLVLEARQSMLLQRVANGADAMSAREALEIATRGGADVLNRPDCGRLALGKRADIALWMFRHRKRGHWIGGCCSPARHASNTCSWKVGQVVNDGQITTIDLPRVIERQNRLARNLQP